MRLTLLSLVALVAALAVSTAVSAAPKKLTATVGPGFTIKMSAKSVAAGSYVITVKDLSNIHNFHLTGPGLNKTTSTPAVKTYTWTVTLKKGTYTFVCDPHKTIMKGTLKVT